MNNLELEKMANEIRKDIVTAVHRAKSGHPGGSLSSADIFTYLYLSLIHICTKNSTLAQKKENHSKAISCKVRCKSWFT